MGAGEGGQLVGAQVFVPVETVQVFWCDGWEVGQLVDGWETSPSKPKRKIIFFVNSC